MDLLPAPLASLLEPLQFLALALSFLPATILSALLALDTTTLLSPSRLRAAWFGRFWTRIGPEVRTAAEKKVVPLLQGQVTHGLIPTTTTTLPSSSESPPHPPVSGTVLEIGPGSGMWTSLFTPRSLPAITKIYGVEPNTTIHPLLRQQIATHDLTSTYEILPLGIEDLAVSGRVPLASVDSIVTVMCLCSIPEPRHNMAQLYGYLKPGGRWYVYEHVRCFREQGVGMQFYQGELSYGFPLLGLVGLMDETRRTVADRLP
jgi:SAM-dependent methyltransferase